MTLAKPSRRPELPPRTRRIRIQIVFLGLIAGTTSAHAENTSPGGKETAARWNYLRARGEYSSTTAPISTSGELPPRTRRILSSVPSTIRRPGTTSAHAENTISRALSKSSIRNYLRARGEYNNGEAWGTLKWELPPRTRRILLKPHSILAKIGTTSAHAENTVVASFQHRKASNYLRARGEYGVP